MGTNMEESKEEETEDGVKEKLLISEISSDAEKQRMRSDKDDGVMKKGHQVFAAVTGGLIAMGVGSSIALTSSLIPQVLEQGIVKDFETASWLATSYLYACIPSCIVGGVVSDMVGRRLLSLLCCPVLLCGWLLISLGPTLPYLLTGRVITACGGWMCYPSASIFISETVHPSVRGYLGVFTSIFLAIGMFQTYLLGYLTHWRTMCWILTVQPLVIFFALLYVKETPYWLITKGRKEEAATSLQWYRGDAWDTQGELQEIVTRKEEQQKLGGIKEIFTVICSKAFLKGMTVSGALFLLCQFTGISTLVVFMSSVFQDSGLTLDSNLAPAIIGGIRVITACVSSLALKTGNRLYIYCSCSLTLSFCCFSLASFSHWRVYLLSLHPIFGVLPLAIVIFMFIAHAFGINSVLHLLMGEIFPSKVRSLGSSLSLCLAMSGNAANSTLYPIIQRYIGFSGIFWVYSASTLLMTIYAYLVIPDNRGLSLARIENNEKVSSLPK